MENTNPFDERLGAALTNLANHEHDAGAAARLSSAHVAPSVLGASETSTRRRRTVYAVLGIPGEPCPGAVQGDPNSLATEIPIWLPAGDGEPKVADAWTCADTPVVVFGDIQISYEAGWADVDVEKKWAALAADYGGDVTTVLGRPGLVQAAEQTKGTNNQVLVVVDGTLVRVLSKSDVPITELLRLADSLDVKSAQGR